MSCEVPLTLQPALPKVNAIALPMPLEAPVTTTTGATTLFVASILACSTAATCTFTPARSIAINEIHILGRWRGKRTYCWYVSAEMRGKKRLKTIVLCISQNILFNFNSSQFYFVEFGNLCMCVRH